MRRYSALSTNPISGVLWGEIAGEISGKISGVLLASAAAVATPSWPADAASDRAAAPARSTTRVCTSLRTTTSLSLRWRPHTGSTMATPFHRTTLSPIRSSEAAAGDPLASMLTRLLASKPTPTPLMHPKRVMVKVIAGAVVGADGEAAATRSARARDVAGASAEAASLSPMTNPLSYCSCMSSEALRSDARSASTSSRCIASAADSAVRSRDRSS